MKEELIRTIFETETYDRENALIDLYIYLRSENETLSSKENTKLFLELSHWRDCSLSNGVESYYETRETETYEIKKIMETITQNNVIVQYFKGIEIYENKGDFSKIDEWIIENEWNINDYLVELLS